MNSSMILKFTLSGTTVSAISGSAHIGETSQNVADLYSQAGGVFSFPKGFGSIAIHTSNDCYVRFDGVAASESTGFPVESSLSIDLDGNNVSFYSASEVTVRLLLVW